MRIAVCVATFNRPDGLQGVLDGLAAQDLPAGLAEGLSVVVVDNSPEGNAGPLVAAAGQACGYPLRYVHEPRRGISNARNAALDSTGDADFVAFLDDDEIPAPDWLRRLADAQRRNDADVVAGPVLPVFVQPPPRWLATGRFLDPVRHPDGAAIAVAYTGNVLFRRALVTAAGIRFSEALGLIGGEDIDFFDRLRAAGADLRFCDGAVVFETIPEHRATLRWLLRRWFRTGNSEAIIYMDRHRGTIGRFVVAGRGTLRITLGLALLGVLAMVAGLGRRHWIIARLYTVARGMGMLSSAFNLHYHEYTQS